MCSDLANVQYSSDRPLSVVMLKEKVSLTMDQKPVAVKSPLPSISDSSETNINRSARVSICEVNQRHPQTKYQINGYHII